MPPFVDSAEYVSGAREGPRKQLQTAYYRQTPPETLSRGVSYISDLLDNFGSVGRDHFQMLSHFSLVPYVTRNPTYLPNDNCRKQLSNLLNILANRLPSESAEVVSACQPGIEGLNSQNT